MSAKARVYELCSYAPIGLTGVHGRHAALLILLATQAMFFDVRARRGKRWLWRARGRAVDLGALDVDQALVRIQQVELKHHRDVRIVQEHFDLDAATMIEVGTNVAAELNAATPGRVWPVFSCFKFRDLLLQAGGRHAPLLRGGPRPAARSPRTLARRAHRARGPLRS